MGKGMRMLSAGIVGVLWLATADAVESQDRWPASFEASIGAGAGRSSGEYRGNDKGFLADLLVGARVGSAFGGGLFGALSFGVQGAGTVTTDCMPASDGGCVDGFPEFTAVSVLGGWERQSTDFRVLSGPAVVRAYGDWSFEGFGWMGRIDIGLPLAGHLSATGSVRGIVVPSYRGESYQLLGVGVGLRIR